MKHAIHRWTLTLVFLAAATMPAAAGTYKVGVPAGTIWVYYITTTTNNSTGQSVVSTTSYCPAFNTITITIPNNSATTTSMASGSFSDANNNVISTFTINQNAVADDGGGQTTKN
jgi:hypothetical protein